MCISYLTIAMSNLLSFIMMKNCGASSSRDDVTCAKFSSATSESTSNTDNVLIPLPLVNQGCNMHKRKNPEIISLYGKGPKEERNVGQRSTRDRVREGATPSCGCSVVNSETLGS